VRRDRGLRRSTEGHALFLNPGSREKRGESDQPTNENESDGESRGIVTKRKARAVDEVVLRLTKRRDLDPRGFSSRTRRREPVHFNRDGLPVFSCRKIGGK